MTIPVKPTAWTKISPANSPEIHSGFAIGLAFGGTSAETQSQALTNLMGGTTKGQIIAYTGSAAVLLSPPAVSNRILSYDSSTTTGLKWVSPSTGGAIASHASSHQNGGSDEIATTTPAVGAIPKAGSTGRLGATWIPLLVGASPSGAGVPGLVPSPLAANRTQFLRGDKSWAQPDHTLLSNIGSYTHAQIDTHINAKSGIHGITGSPVGTTDTQLLTNKRLVAPRIMGSPLDTDNIYFLRTGSPADAGRFNYSTRLFSITRTGTSPINYIGVSTATRNSHPRISAFSYNPGGTTNSQVNVDVYPAGTGRLRAYDPTAASIQNVVLTNDARLGDGRPVPIASPNEDIDSALSGKPSYPRFSEETDNFGLYFDGTNVLSTPHWISSDTTELMLTSKSGVYQNFSPNDSSSWLALPGDYRCSASVGFKFGQKMLLREVIVNRESPVGSPLIAIYRDGALATSFNLSPTENFKRSLGYSFTSTSTQYWSVKASGVFGSGSVTLRFHRVFEI
jgi:hypothetical protein